MRRIVSRLLAREPVFRGVQRALRSSNDARRAVDRNVGRALAGLNIASHQEVVRLHEDIRALEREVTALVQRAERLAAQAPPRPSAREPTAKP